MNKHVFGCSRSFVKEPGLRVQSHDLPIDRRHAQVGDVSITYQVAGAGEPLVLIHGLSGTSRWWSRNIEPLSRHFRVYAVDLIYFEERRSRQPFVLRQAANSLAQWMAQIGVERAHVVGHSMGGFIAAELAADFPDTVDRLVLVDAAALPFEPRTVLAPRGVIQGVRYLPFKFIPTLLLDAYRWGPVTLLNAARELLTTDIRPKLVRITAPTLAIWGEYDLLVPLEMGKRLASYIRDVEMVVIKGVSHNPMWEAPHTFNRLVTEFLAVERPARAPENDVRFEGESPADYGVPPARVVAATIADKATPR